MGHYVFGGLAIGCFIALAWLSPLMFAIIMVGFCATLSLADSLSAKDSYLKVGFFLISLGQFGALAGLLIDFTKNEIAASVAESEAE